MVERGDGSTVEVRFELRIGGRPAAIRSRVPERAAPVSALLESVRNVTEAVIGHARAQAEAEGETVSCRAGCGACCRQPVPIAESEAFALARLIASWPEGRRRRVESRFAEALTRLDAAGLQEKLHDLADLPDIDARQRVGRAYFDLGLACPFLEDESCSIHADRPIACREYLVTSEPAECADPGPDRIDLVRIPVRPSVALFRMTSEGFGPDSRPLLLVEALDRVAAHAADEPATTSGPALLESYVRGLAGGAA